MPPRRPRSSSQSQGQHTFYDPLQQAPVNGMARAPSYRRQGGIRRVPTDPMAGNYTVQPLPAATTLDGPREPSQTYKDPYVVTGPARQTDGVRSFSARTRDLPPNNAFSHPDNFSPVENTQYADRSSGQPLSSNGQQLPPQRSESYGRAPDAVVQPQTNASLSPPTRSSTLKSTGESDEKRRGWAPDRSPLQKLEVKLDDITKEEKRARVESAERLARERLAARVSRLEGGDAGSPQPTRNRSVKDPASFDVAGLARSQSSRPTTQQRSAPQGPQNPEPQSVPRDSRGAYPEQPSGQYNQTKPPTFRSSSMQYGQTGGYGPRTPPDQQFSRSRSIATKPQHGRHMSTAYAPENDPAQFRDSNASNRASWAGAAPIGPASAAALERVNKQNYQMQPDRSIQPQPAVETRAMPLETGPPQQVQRSVSSRAAPPPQSTDVPPTGVSKKAQDKLGMGSEQPIGLGLSRDQDGQNTDSPEIPPAPKSTKTKSKQTVSFDVPPPTPPPLMEWKNAPVAKLRAIDLLREIDQSVAWWEGGRSDYRRSKSFAPEDSPRMKASKEPPPSSIFIAIFD